MTSSFSVIDEIGPKPYDVFFIDVEVIARTTFRIGFLKGQNRSYAGHVEMEVSDARSYDRVFDAALCTIARMANRCIYEIHFFTVGGKWLYFLRESGLWHCGPHCEFCLAHRMHDALWVKDLMTMGCPVNTDTDQMVRLKGYAA